MSNVRTRVKGEILWISASTNRQMLPGRSGPAIRPARKNIRMKADDQTAEREMKLIMETNTISRGLNGIWRQDNEEKGDHDKVR